MREALHAEPVNKIGTWTLCTTRINYTRDNAEYSMIPIHKGLMWEHATCCLLLHMCAVVCVCAIPPSP